MKLAGWIFIAGVLAAINPVTDWLVDWQLPQAKAETGYTKSQVEALNNLIVNSHGRNDFRKFKMTHAEQDEAIGYLYGSEN